MSLRREFRVEGQAEPISHFTNAVQAGELLFVSGIVAVDERRELVGGDDIIAQARCVFENMRQVRQEAFGETRPASTLVEVPALVIPGAKIEIECIALIPT